MPLAKVHERPSPHPTAADKTDHEVDVPKSAADDPSRAIGIVRLRISMGLKIWLAGTAINRPIAKEDQKRLTARPASTRLTLDTKMKNHVEKTRSAQSKASTDTVSLRTAKA